MEIQRLTAKEGPRLRAIRLRSLAEAPDAFESTFEEAAAREPEGWARQIEELATFVAVVDGSDVGLARGAPDRERDDTAWLISMWVDPAARRRGVGAALVDAVIAWARSRGVARLSLDVGDDNAPAIALYHRKGFEPTGELSSFGAPRQHIREHRRCLLLS